MMVAMPLGGFMSMKHAHRESKAFQEASVEEQNRINGIIRLKRLAESRLVNNVGANLKTFKDAEGKESYINPDTGNYELDLDKEANRLQRQGIALDREQIANQTALVNDELNFNRNIQDALFSDVWTNTSFQNLGVDEETLQDIYNLNPNLDGTTAEELGIEGVYKENKADIDKYAKIFFDLQKQIYTPSAIANASLPFQYALKQELKNRYFLEASKQAIINAAKRSGKVITNPNLLEVTDLERTDDPLFDSQLEELAGINQALSNPQTIRDIIKSEIEELGNLQVEQEKLKAIQARTESEQDKIDSLEYRILEESIKNSARDIKIGDTTLYSETFRQIARERLVDTTYDTSSPLRAQSKMRLGFSTMLDALIDEVEVSDLTPSQKLEKVITYLDSIQQYLPFTSKFISFFEKYSPSYQANKYADLQEAIAISDTLNKLVDITPTNQSGAWARIEELLTGE